tara:strand:- start:624 stop:1025 length:402 start_codon:yes stop_codon:yes gene_type:complete
MRITRKTLRRIIEDCGGGMPHAAPEAPVEVAIEPVAVEPQSSISESIGPEQEMMVEMAAASKALEIVVEAAQSAAQLCVGCSPEIAAHAPVMEAVVSQAAALQEMLDAQAEVIVENTQPQDDLVDAILDVTGV